MKLFNKPSTSRGMQPITKIAKPNKRLVLKPSENVKKSTIKDELEFLKINSRTRVCVYRGCGGIGDILMATPLLQALKETYPECHLTFSIDTKSAGDTYYQIVKNNPYIDEIVSAHECKRETYHLFKDISSVCLQYENSGLPWINRIDIFANACGFKLKDPKVFYKVEEEERVWATDLINKITKGKRDQYKIVMLHTASYDYKRTWPIHKYTELISYLNSKRSDIIYFVNDFQGLYQGWQHIKNVTNITPYPIREKAALTEQIDCFLGPDSGPMHIAGALEVPGVVMFGSIPPQSRINHYPSLEAVSASNLACLGCGYKSCPINIKCMTSLSAEKVGNKILERLNENI